MSLKHMISALRFSRLTAFFLVLETAIACAFLCNVLAFITQQAGPMLTPAGVAPDQVLFARVQFPITFDSETHSVGGGADPADLQTAETRIRALPGVTAVGVGVGLPYTSVSYGMMPLYAVQTGRTIKVSTYRGRNLVRAMGLELVEGRGFNADELAAQIYGTPANPPVIILSQQVARRLFPAGNALGQRVKIGGKESSLAGAVVVGIVRHLTTFQPVESANSDAAAILPTVPGKGDPAVAIVVRTHSSARADVARRLTPLIKQTLQLQRGVAPVVHSFETMHSTYFRGNRSMIWLMLGVTLAVVAITVIGIMGLTGFWVQRRTRMIGIRRALGATRADILRYFLVENLLVIGTGALLGVVAAYGGNLWLMGHLEVPRLPWQWLPIGAVFLCVLGQLAVLAPARRAAAVPPVVATRGV